LQELSTGYPQIYPQSINQ